MLTRFFFFYGLGIDFYFYFYSVDICFGSSGVSIYVLSGFGWMVLIEWCWLMLVLVGLMVFRWIIRFGRNLDFKFFFSWVLFFRVFL